MGHSRSILFVVLVSLVPSLAAAKSKKWTAEKAVDDCSRQHLLQKDCHIQLDTFQLHIWHDKILLNSQVDRLTKPLPVQAELPAQVINWEFIRGKKLGGRKFLETGLWTPPKGEADVETLIWTVYEITASELTKQIEQPIQKRKKLSTEKYKFDKVVSHGLAAKAGKIVWHAHREKGVF